MQRSCIVDVPSMEGLGVSPRTRRFLAGSTLDNDKRGTLVFTAVGEGSAGRAKTTVRNGMAPKRHSGCSTGDAGTTARLAARRCGAAQSQRDERLQHARTHLRLLALGTRGLTHIRAL